MTRRRVCLSLVVAISAAVIMVTPVQAQFVVYDPTNWAENVLQAARALEQIDNQIRSLENEAQMLLNEARNLSSLNYSAVATIDGALGQISDLLNQADRIGYDVNAINMAFDQRYRNADVNATDAALIAAAQERWTDAVSAFQHSMTLQAGAVQSLPGVRVETDALVAQSQGAVGILQATQSGNQILALQASQLADLTGVLAADARARALGEARQTAAEAQAREQYRRFLARANGYMPTDVRMFHP